MCDIMSHVFHDPRVPSGLWRTADFMGRCQLLLGNCDQLKDCFVNDNDHTKVVKLDLDLCTVCKGTLLCPEDPSKTGNLNVKKLFTD